MAHIYKEDSISFEQIPDGYYTVGNRNGVPDLLFFGEMSVIVKTVKYFIGPNPIGIAKGLGTITIKPATESLIGINVSGSKFYADGTLWWYYEETYIKLPSLKTAPSSDMVLINSQITQSGVTLDGSPVISGTTKGINIAHTFTGNTNKKTGETEMIGNSSFLITSVSKSNKRYINGEETYNVSISYQEF